MGTYTKFEFKATLSKDIPPKIIYAISAAVNFIEKDIDTTELPEFFQLPRWGMCISTSKYETQLNLDDYGNYKLVIHSEFKNYDSEIQHFIDMVLPFIVGRKKKQFLGFSQRECSDRRYYYKER